MLETGVQGAGEADFLLKNYGYFLPEEQVALYPAPVKDACRLLALDRYGREDESAPRMIDDVFSNIARHLPENALLVANNSKVLPARIMARRPGGGRLEFLLLTPLPLLLAAAQKDGDWQSASVDCLLRPAAKIKTGAEIDLAPDLRIVVGEKGEYGRHKARLFWRGNLEGIFSACGRLPLPPYIKREAELSDADAYQTVYAKKTGAVAAPTAGLHFTPRLRQSLADLGFGWVEATLYVGYGTFSPVRCEDIRQHKMHSEYVEFTWETARAVKEAKKAGRPIVAVGTTSLRLLEGMWEKTGAIEPWSGWTDIFIYPGKKINIVEGLITNFHLPHSTLLMLVAAFAGRKRILEAYAHAVESGYRFFSYGDAMLIC